MRKNRIVDFISILFILFLFSSCATNPVTGKKELMLFSEQAEINLGKNVHKSLSEQYYFYNEMAVDEYVRKVGEKLAVYTHRKNLKYHFYVLDTSVVNAFAAPGGYIYVTRGLLSMLNSEAELAVVIGHELGHVNARHSVKALTKKIIFTAALAVASALSEDVRKISPFIGIGGALLFLKYSRDNEYQADSLGILYARKAGYSPEGIVSFFSSLERLEVESGGTRLPNFLSTHPLTEKRILKAEKQITSEDRALYYGAFSYLKSINGISYGNDPRNGFERRRVYYHPRAGFSVEIPEGWKIARAPKRILIQDRKKRALIVIKVLGKSGYENMAKINDDIISEFENPRIVSSYNESLKGFRAYKTEFLSYPSKEGSEPLWGRVLTFSSRKSTVSALMITYSSKQWVYSHDFSYIEHSIRGFNFRELPKIYRIKIVKAKGKTLSDIIKEHRIKKSIYRKVLLINNLDGSQNRLKRNFVKIIK